MGSVWGREVKFPLTASFNGEPWTKSIVGGIRIIGFYHTSNGVAGTFINNQSNLRIAGDDRGEIQIRDRKIQS